MKSLALVMIARDEARCIERCLASARPFVDRLLVLDTGSTDGTAELARRAGAQVHAFDWVDDFSAARNHALALADADWSLVLDADEWIADGGDAIAGLRTTEPTFAAQLRVDSEFDSGDDVAVAPSWLARVLPRGARFQGRIHEQVDPGLQRRRLGVRVGHDGYRGARRAAKSGRNERLLRLALAERPGDPYLHYQLGKDLEQADAFDAALPHYEAAYAGARPPVPWRHDLVLRLLFALKRCRQWARAVAVADAEMPRWRHTAGYHFVVGDLLLDWAAAEPARAPQLLPMIEASWEQCLAIGDNLDLEGAVAGRGSYLAAHNLAAFHTALGHVAQAERFQALERVMRRGLAAA